MKLKVGDKAPNFPSDTGLPDQDGRFHKLSDYSGKWVLLYFYPKDDTQGCTAEACSLRDSFPSFSTVDTVVLGVSADSPESHKKFADKYKLPFTLLADTEKKLIESYGVWGIKSFLGKYIEGILRTSFLINPSGLIVKVYEQVNPKVHANEVLADLKSMK
jgi:thioredoxin-dependent peroxiredoxin